MSEIVIDFDEIFGNYVKSIAKEWAHDRSKSVGASEVFDCLRKAWFTKRGTEMGYTPDEEYEEDWGAMERGNLIENYFLAPALQNNMPAGLKAEFVGEDQVTLGLGYNTATPDGLITGLPMNCAVRVRGGTQDIFIPDIKSDCIVLELKSIDPRATLVEERAKHHGQTQVQLGLFRDTTDYKPHYSIILYIDASFLSKFTPFVVEFDENTYAAAGPRATNVFTVDDPKKLFAEGRYTGACQYCKWRIACGKSTVSLIPKYDEDKQSTPETIEKMDGLLVTYFDMKAKSELAEKELGVQKAKITEFLAQRNTRKMQAPTASVTWYGQEGKKTYNTAAMEADGIDLTPYEKQGADFDVVRITPRLKPTKEKAKTK